MGFQSHVEYVSEMRNRMCSEGLRTAGCEADGRNDEDWVLGISVVSDINAEVLL